MARRGRSGILRRLPSTTYWLLCVILYAITLVSMRRERERELEWKYRPSPETLSSEILASKKWYGLMCAEIFLSAVMAAVDAWYPGNWDRTAARQRFFNQMSRAVQTTTRLRNWFRG